MKEIRNHALGIGSGRSGAWACSPAFIFHAHRWRHTFATQLLSKGVPVSEVAAILGNSPRIIEKHYSQWIHARQDSVNAAVKATC